VLDALVAAFSGWIGCHVDCCETGSELYDCK
jgi:hypothetical protein